MSNIPFARRVARLFLLLAVTAMSAHAQITFCSGVIVPPGQGFVNNSGQQSGLAAGNYLMTIQQSGPFTIQNLQGAWNGIAIGAYQFIPGSATVAISGIVPSSASPGQTVTVTLKVYNLLSQLVLTGSTTVTAAGSTSAWTKVWQGGIANGGIANYELFYPGDFDGDGDEEILAVDSANPWMTMFYYESGAWQWGWSNYGNPNAGNGIYPYRNNLLVGDFDADGKDEVLGTDGGWITMFHFDNGAWQWGWSNYGNPNAGGGIVPYQNGLVVGDFDGVLISGRKRDEVLGVSGGWMTMFHFDNGDWQWGWSNYGNPNAGGGIYPYRFALRAGDFDADGKDEVLGLSSWATVFHFDNGDWQWGWSTYGASSLGGWGYPLRATDRLIIGNIDTHDAMEELMFIQTGSPGNSGWATTMDFAGGVPNWRWSTNANPPFIGDWPVMDYGSPSAAYLFVKAVANQPDYLLARRKLCSGAFDMRMYKVANPAADF